MRIVCLKDVSLLLVEEFDAMLGVAQQDVFGIQDHLVPCSGCVDASKYLEPPILVVSEFDHLFCIYCCVCLLDAKNLSMEVVISEIESDVDA